jgi:hypothetical protein
LLAHGNTLVHCYVKQKQFLHKQPLWKVPLFRKH